MTYLLLILLPDIRSETVTKFYTRNLNAFSKNLFHRILNISSKFYSFSIVKQIFRLHLSLNISRILWVSIFGKSWGIGCLNFLKHYFFINFPIKLFQFSPVYCCKSDFSWHILPWMLLLFGELCWYLNNKTR